MRHWINDLLRYGLARLQNCPTDEDFLLEFAAQVGAGAGHELRADLGREGRHLDGG